MEGETYRAHGRSRVLFLSRNKIKSSFCEGDFCSEIIVFEEL